MPLFPAGFSGDTKHRFIGAGSVQVNFYGTYLYALTIKELFEIFLFLNSFSAAIRSDIDQIIH
jgi:hypothetical protein